MRNQDGFPVATKLQGILTKLYGFCHLFVSHKGYYLQTAYKGRMFHQTLPFIPTQANVDAIMQAFAEFHAPLLPPKAEPTQSTAQVTAVNTVNSDPAPVTATVDPVPTPTETKANDRPRRRSNRKPAST